MVLKGGAIEKTMEGLVRTRSVACGDTVALCCESWDRPTGDQKSADRRGETGPLDGVLIGSGHLLVENGDCASVTARDGREVCSSAAKKTTLYRIGDD